MVNQFNCEENHFPVTSSPLKHLGTVLLLMRQQLNYEANRSIFTVIVFVVHYQSNYDANRDIFTLTSFSSWQYSNNPVMKQIETSSRYHRDSIFLFILYQLNHEENPKSSPWHLGIVLTAMLYQLIYEGDGNITLTLRHRSPVDALPNEQWRKSKYHPLNILALFFW